MKRLTSLILTLLLVLTISLPVTTFAQAVPADESEAVVSVTNYAPNLDEQNAYQIAVQGVNELSVKAKELGLEITPSARFIDNETSTVRQLQSYSSTQMLQKTEYADRSVDETYVTTAATTHYDTNSKYAGVNVTIYARVYWTLHYDTLGIPYVNCTRSEHWVVQSTNAVTTMTLSSYICTTFPATYQNSRNVSSPSSGTHYTLNSPYTADIAYLTETDAHFWATTEAYLDGNLVVVDINHKF